MPNGLYNLPTNLDLPYWISALGPTARLGSTELGQTETIGVAYLESGTSPYGESLRAFTDAEKANVMASLVAVSENRREPSGLFQHLTKERRTSTTHQRENLDPKKKYKNKRKD